MSMDITVKLTDAQRAAMESGRLPPRVKGALRVLAGRFGARASLVGRMETMTADQLVQSVAEMIAGAAVGVRPVPEEQQITALEEKIVTLREKLVKRVAAEDLIAAQKATAKLKEPEIVVPPIPVEEETPSKEKVK
jgi:hypothetical protein